MECKGYPKTRKEGAGVLELSQYLLFSRKGGGHLLVEDMINIPLGSLVVLPLEIPAHEARKILDNNGSQTGLVVDEDGCLLGRVRQASLPRENGRGNLLQFMESTEQVVYSYENAGILPSLFEDRRHRYVYVINQEE
ncbi:MAG TPA: hypothetical protein GX711_09700, partial [Clostridia bacterium]|nr:hypothetical protein [Clostridia bacterium]